jgi:hypothetical protein
MKLSTTLVFLISIASALALPLAAPAKDKIPAKRPIKQWNGTPSTIDNSHTGSVEELEDKRMGDASMLESPEQRLEDARTKLKSKIAKKSKKKEGKSA